MSKKVLMEVYSDDDKVYCGQTEEKMTVLEIFAAQEAMLLTATKMLKALKQAIVKEEKDDKTTKTS